MGERRKSRATEIGRDSLKHQAGEDEFYACGIRHLVNSQLGREDRKRTEERTRRRREHGRRNRISGVVGVDM
jgi:hypothetical protein